MKHKLRALWAVLRGRPTIYGVKLLCHGEIWLPQAGDVREGLWLIDTAFIGAHPDDEGNLRATVHFKAPDILDERFQPKIGTVA